LFLLGSKLPPPATDAHAQDRPAAAYAWIRAGEFGGGTKEEEEEEDNWFSKGLISD
jgi:hypothetical protein